MLALATLAKIKFDVADGRLVMFSSHANWKLWMPVRAYLDEVGVEAIVDYFARTTSEDRAVLSAAAKNPRGGEEGGSLSHPLQNRTAA